MFEQCKRVNLLMSGFGRPWGIAGGWAVDLYVNKETREHSDLEIAVFRSDQAKLIQYLDSFRFRKVVNGELVNWEGEELILPVHELHASNGNQEIEILLNEVEDRQWIFRRDPQIRFGVEQFVQKTAHGIPYLHPAVVLLYKAKHMREKDHHDFLTLKDELKERDRSWLLNSLEIHQPDHPWIRLLGGKRT